MASSHNPVTAAFEVAPYFDVLLEKLKAGDERAQAAFGRHVHWGYWTTPSDADGTPEDYGAAAERLCQKVCDAADIRDGMRILDVGCGIGGTIASLNERFSNLNMIGVNIDNRQLERARATIKPLNQNCIRFMEADACALPFDAKSFDVVLAVECIFHFPSRATFLSEVGKVLIPGGKLSISDFIPPEDAVPLLKQLKSGQDEATKQSYGQVDLLCTEAEYRRLAASAGLEVRKCESISENTFPTYDFLRADQRLWPDRAVARMHEKATSRLEMASREGLLNYSILSFTKIG